MISMEALGARFYGGAAAEPVAAVQGDPVALAAPASEEPAHEAVPASADPGSGPTVEKIRAAIPKEIAEQRNSMIRRFYGNDAQIAKVLPDDAFKADGHSPEFTAALASEVRAMAADIGAQPVDVQMIRSAIAESRQAPLTEEARVANREKIVDALNLRYGEHARDAWMTARRFVEADPRRAAVLSLVGDHPGVALRVVELAMKARDAGRHK